jgi:hypothetical protein
VYAEDSGGAGGAGCVADMAGKKRHGGIGGGIGGVDGEAVKMILDELNRVKEEIFRHILSKARCILTSQSTYTRTLTFENFCQ